MRSVNHDKLFLASLGFFLVALACLVYSPLFSSAHSGSFASLLPTFVAPFISLVISAEQVARRHWISLPVLAASILILVLIVVASL